MATKPRDIPSALRNELKALLEKYDVSIVFSVGEGSDLHGVYDERIELVENGTDEVLIKMDGYGLSALDLKRMRRG